MKNIIEYIEQFLKNKNYEWVNRQIFGNYGYIPAKDSDFTKNEIQDFKLKNKDGFAVLHSIDRKYPDLFLDRIIVNTKIKNAIKI